MPNTHARCFSRMLGASWANKACRGHNSLASCRPHPAPRPANSLASAQAGDTTEGSSQGRRYMHDVREAGSQHSSFFPGIPWSPGASPCPPWVGGNTLPPAPGALHTQLKKMQLQPQRRGAGGGVHSPEAPRSDALSHQADVFPTRLPTQLLAFLQDLLPALLLVGDMARHLETSPAASP